MPRIADILRTLAGPAPAVPAGPAVTIRAARPADAAALAVLAELDSSRPPRGAVLVAEVGGELWAAASAHDGHVISNPFRPSGELAFHLLARARELRRVSRPGRRWTRGRRAPSPAPRAGCRAPRRRRAAAAS